MADYIHVAHFEAVLESLEFLDAGAARLVRVRHELPVEDDGEPDEEHNEREENGRRNIRSDHQNVVELDPA